MKDYLRHPFRWRRERLEIITAQYRAKQKTEAMFAKAARPVLYVTGTNETYTQAQRREMIVAQMQKARERTIRRQRGIRPGQSLDLGL